MDAIAAYNDAVAECVQLDKSILMQRAEIVSKLPESVGRRFLIFTLYSSSEEFACTSRDDFQKRKQAPVGKRPRYRFTTGEEEWLKLDAAARKAFFDKMCDEVRAAARALPLDQHMQSIVANVNALEDVKKQQVAALKRAKEALPVGSVVNEYAPKQDMSIIGSVTVAPESANVESKRAFVPTPPVVTSLPPPAPVAVPIGARLSSFLGFGQNSTPVPNVPPPAPAPTPQSVGPSINDALEGMRDTASALPPSAGVILNRVADSCVSLQDAEKKSADATARADKVFESKLSETAKEDRPLMYFASDMVKLINTPFRGLLVCKLNEREFDDDKRSVREFVQDLSHKQSKGASTSLTDVVRFSSNQGYIVHAAREGSNFWNIEKAVYYGPCNRATAKKYLDRIETASVVCVEANAQRRGNMTVTLV
jgi:hypothetical protein